MGGGLKTNQGDPNTILLVVTYQKIVGGTASNPTYTYNIYTTVTVPNSSNDPTLPANLIQAFQADNNSGQPGHEGAANHFEFLYTYNDNIPNGQATNPPAPDWSKYTLSTYTTNALTNELGQVLVTFKSSKDGKKIRVKGIAVPPTR